MSAVSSCEIARHLLGADADLGDVLRERHQVVAGGEDGRGGLGRVRPALGELLEAAPQLLGGGRRGHVHAESEAAFLEDLEVVRELVAAVLHLGEGRAAGRGPRGSPPWRGAACGTASARPPSRTSRSATRAVASTNTMSAVRATRPRAIVPRMFICVVIGQVPRSAAGGTCPCRTLPAGAAFLAAAPPMVDVGPPGLVSGPPAPAGSSSWTTRGGSGPAPAAFGLGEVRLPEPVRERRLGFCRWCFGHGVLRAAWCRRRRRRGPRPSGYRPRGIGVPSRAGRGPARARSRPRRPWTTAPSHGGRILRRLGGDEVLGIAQPEHARHEQPRAAHELVRNQDHAPLRAAGSRLAALEGRKVDDAVEVAPHVGHAAEPGLRERHRHERRNRDHLAHLVQRHEPVRARDLEAELRRKRRARARPCEAARRPKSGIREGRSGGPSGRGASAERLDLVDQVRFVDRLGDVVLGALPQAPDLVRLLVLGRADDHRDVLGRLLARDRAGRLEAVRARASRRP